MSNRILDMWTNTLYDWYAGMAPTAAEVAAIDAILTATPADAGATAQALYDHVMAAYPSPTAQPALNAQLTASLGDWAPLYGNLLTLAYQQHVDWLTLARVLLDDHAAGLLPTPPVSQTLTGTARITASGIQTLTGVARISVMGTQTLTGTAHIA